MSSVERCGPHPVSGQVTSTLHLAPAKFCHPWACAQADSSVLNLRLCSVSANFVLQGFMETYSLTPWGTEKHPHSDPRTLKSTYNDLLGV